MSLVGAIDVSFGAPAATDDPTRKRRARCYILAITERCELAHANNRQRWYWSRKDRLSTEASWWMQHFLLLATVCLFGGGSAEGAFAESLALFL